MKFVGPDVKAFHLPDLKAEPTQELLGEVYDRLDDALDFLECVYQATFGPDINDETGHPLRAVLDAAKAKVKSAKDKLARHNRVGVMTRNVRRVTDPIGPGGYPFKHRLGTQALAKGTSDGTVVVEPLLRSLGLFRLREVSRVPLFGAVSEQGPRRNLPRVRRHACRAGLPCRAARLDQQSSDLSAPRPDLARAAAHRESAPLRRQGGQTMPAAASPRHRLERGSLAFSDNKRIRFGLFPPRYSLSDLRAESIAGLSSRPTNRFVKAKRLDVIAFMKRPHVHDELHNVTA